MKGVLVTCAHSLAVLLVIFIFSVDDSGALTKKAYQSAELSVLFDARNEGTARTIVEAFPTIRDELEEELGIDPAFRPGVTVVLASGAEFEATVGTDIIVAFARAQDNLVVIDVSKVLQGPFELRSTLKHELSHLALGNHIEPENLPKWLNEGISQWVSGGASELMNVGKSTELTRAVLFGGMLPLRDLNVRFPSDEKYLRLAYEESLNIVEFIVETYGKDGLINVISRIHAGNDVNSAVMNVLSMDMGELEAQWREHLRIKHTWLVYVSNNIYAVLFIFAALITLYGFARVMIRIKTYRDEESEEDTQKYD